MGLGIELRKVKEMKENETKEMMEKGYLCSKKNADIIEAIVQKAIQKRKETKVDRIM